MILSITSFGRHHSGLATKSWVLKIDAAPQIAPTYCTLLLACLLVYYQLAINSLRAETIPDLFTHCFLGV